MSRRFQTAGEWLIPADEETAGDAGISMIGALALSLGIAIQNFPEGTYVVIEELIPEAQAGEHSNIGTLGAAAGFALMMVLDVALG